MKIKTLIFALASVMLLSFTLLSATQPKEKPAMVKIGQATDKGHGIAMEDQDQWK